MDLKLFAACVLCLLIHIASAFSFSSAPRIPDSYKDYCDPRHCAVYTRTTCGYNRKSNRFQWFQSTCHLLLNNYCAKYRGFYRFDLVANKFCTNYVMDLRDSCPSTCSDEMRPVCGTSRVDGHLVLFKNECYIDLANCRGGFFDDYEGIDMKTCILEFKDELE